MTSRQLVVAHDGVRIAVHELGAATGVPLVVVHGGPDWDHRYLLPGLEPVARARRVVALDLRGCGASQRGLPPGSCTPSAAVRDILDVIEAVGTPPGAPVDLLGFSFGGTLALRVAAEHPDRLRTLVLASTSAYGAARQRSSQEASPLWRSRRGLVPPRRWPEAGVPAETLAAVSRQWAVEQAPFDVWCQRRLPGYLRLLDSVDFSGEWLAEVARGGMAADPAVDGPAVLRRLAVPVLVLHGAQDLTFPVAMAHELAADVPGLQVTVVDDAGHMTHVDRPEPWASAVLDFLGEVDAQAPGRKGPVRSDAPPSA